MKKALYALVIFSFISVYPQNFREGTSISIFLLPQGYGIEQLNSKGTSGILNDVSNIGGMNPASINQFKNQSFGLSYQFQTKITEAYTFSLGLKRVYNAVPQSAGGILKINNFTFGLGFIQRYNGNMVMEPIQVTTVILPEGTGLTYTPEFKDILQNYSLSGTYTFNHFLENDFSLSLGIKYILNRFSTWEGISSFSAEGVFWESNFEAGLCYSYNFAEDKLISLGLSYLSKIEFVDNLNMNDLGTTIIPDNDPNNRTPIYVEIATPSVKLDIPSITKFDLLYQLSSSFKAAAGLKIINWSDVNSNVKDQPDYFFGFIYLPGNSVETSLGFYHTDYNYKTDLYSLTDQMNAEYITAGISFNIQMVNVDLALADSHLFSGENRKQTIGKIGIGMVF